MTYRIVEAGPSRSFPQDHPFLSSAQACASAIVFIGESAGTAFISAALDAAPQFIAIELGTECLGVHTGEQAGGEGSNVLGFARFRLGDEPPTDLVELVRQPKTSPGALEAARHAFERAGLKVAVCGDFPGRIVNRLARPYYNAALRRLDEGLASAAELDTTLRLGLGYPEGPISLLERTGLAHHHDVTAALHAQLGDPAYAPARRAQVAKAREGRRRA